MDAATTPTPTTTCPHDGRAIKARGLCSRCLYRFYTYGDPTIRDQRGARARIDPAARFFERTTPGPVSARRPDLGPCLLWTGPPNPGGYGTAWDGKRSVGAHVLAVTLSGRLIFPGEEPDHLCGVRLCVQETHLEVVPQVVNVRRAVAVREARRAGRRAGLAAAGLLVPA